MQSSPTHGLLLLALQEGGWAMASFARAAELLKYTWPGWEASGVEGRYISWVKALVMPNLQHDMLNKLPLANWQTTVSGERCASRPSTLASGTIVCACWKA